jgi:Protein of unknown function DUF262
LRQLHGLVESGIFAVPELQREFVWNARKACDLLDSVFRNYPIGTILIWKAERRYENQLRKQFHILPHFNPGNWPNWPNASKYSHRLQCEWQAPARCISQNRAPLMSSLRLRRATPAGRQDVLGTLYLRRSLGERPTTAWTRTCRHGWQAFPRMTGRLLAGRRAMPSGSRDCMRPACPLCQPGNRDQPRRVAVPMIMRQETRQGTQLWCARRAANIDSSDGLGVGMLTQRIHARG